MVVLLPDKREFRLKEAYLLVINELKKGGEGGLKNSTSVIVMFKGR
jgi:hypothetical protein